MWGFWWIQNSWLAAFAEMEKHGTCHCTRKCERWGHPSRSWIPDLPYVCHTCIMHVPPTGNSENTKYVSILRGNFVLLTWVSMIPDHFILWKDKGELSNMQTIPFWSRGRQAGSSWLHSAFSALQILKAFISSLDTCLKIKVTDQLHICKVWWLGKGVWKVRFPCVQVLSHQGRLPKLSQQVQGRSFVMLCQADTDGTFLESNNMH